MENLDPDALQRVLILEVIRHWAGVGAYELHVVGRACQYLLDEDLPLDLATALGQVYVDEGHHFLMGRQQVRWLKEVAVGLDLATQPLDLPTAESTSHLSRTEVLAAAWVAELTTSQAFLCVPEDEAVDPQIRHAIRAHRQDEGRHRAVFRLALQHHWAHAGERARTLLIEALIDTAAGLGEVSAGDLTHWRRQLVLVVPPAQADAIQRQLDKPQRLAQAVADSGLKLELQRAGVLDDRRARERLGRAGLVDDVA